MTDQRILIRDIEPADAEAWAPLYRGYRDFYEMAHDDAVIATTWGWLLRGEHTMRGLVAVDEDGTLLGLANIRVFPRPSYGRLAIFLDDLFTADSARGRGVATTLLDRIAEIAREHDAIVVRWLTAEDNTRARRVYDAVAVKTKFLTYDMDPRARG